MTTFKSDILGTPRLYNGWDFIEDEYSINVPQSSHEDQLIKTPILNVSIRDTSTGKFDYAMMTKFGLRYCALKMIGIRANYEFMIASIPDRSKPKLFAVTVATDDPMLTEGVAHDLLEQGARSMSSNLCCPTLKIDRVAGIQCITDAGMILKEE